MDSSSNDSFAWTHASSDSFDSDKMVTNNTTVDQFDDESESGKAYKKKLKKQLRLSSTPCSDDSNVQSDKYLKKKIKQEKILDKDNGHNHLKVEPESDVEIKKKIKYNEQVNGDGHSEDSNNESYINLKVKEEHAGSVAKLNVLTNGKKSLDRSESELSDSSVVPEKKKKKKSKKIEYDNIDVCSDNNINNSVNDTEHLLTNKKHKKKKKDKYKNASDIDDTIIEDKYNAKDTIVGIVEVDTDHGVNTSDSSLTPTVKDKKRKRDKPKHKLPKISDRITFEDDKDSVIERSPEHLEHIGQTSQLQQYLKTNNKLQQLIPKAESDLLLTHDEEVWILKCPSDVNTDALYGANLKLESKCKIKVDGQTYEGTVDDNTTRIPIVTSDHGKFITKTLPLKGIINLHKKIPKAHFADGSIIVNKQTNFIPLPDTKCRHPLFGLKYKKAIKVPSAVAQRLTQCHEQTTIHEQGTGKVKKKNKKHKYQDRPPVCYTDSIVESEELQQAPLDIFVKSKKKRKHSEERATPPKKIKRRKYDHRSTEGWESEKAIEKNLFDF